MAPGHHLRAGLGERTRAKIITVDTTTKRVEAAIKDGSPIHIAVWDVPSAFRWPQENEIWIVRRDGGYWMLDHRVQSAKAEAAPVTSMAPGDMKLDADIVLDASGRTFVAVDLTGIGDGWTLKWNATLKRFVASP